MRCVESARGRGTDELSWGSPGPGIIPVIKIEGGGRGGVHSESAMNLDKN